MTTAHILILIAFIFLGGAGIAAMQESLIMCLRFAFGRKAPSNNKAPSYRCQELAVR